MSFTLQILLGLTLGIFTGLFLGDIAAPFSVAGDIYIALLQMTVLPYIVVSLIGNLGRISWSESRGLLIAAMVVLATLLLLGVVVLIGAPLAFPEWASASFFSPALVQAPQSLDLVALYIPANPFGSLANNVVPAAVLFSILLGIGLSGIKGNDSLLQSLDVVADALNRINKMVIRLTPFGVYAIAAAPPPALTDRNDRTSMHISTYPCVGPELAGSGAVPTLNSRLLTLNFSIMNSSFGCFCSEDPGYGGQARKACIDDCRLMIDDCTYS
jgi:Na+/serine symporter